MTLLRDGALATTAVWLAAELVAAARRSESPGNRALPALACAALVALLASRAWVTAFMPLTTKFESFVGFAATLLGAAAIRYPHTALPTRVLLAGLVLASLTATTAFPAEITYPSPLLFTAWYLAHVPLSFAGYACFIVAAGHGLDWWAGASTRDEFATRQEADLRAGLLFFSAAMVFGSVWGLVSWGAYFLWDAKVIWSFASWLYFATLVHLRYWPLRAGHIRAGLGALGLVVIAITYVGTSFMTGSIHSF